MKKLLLTGAAAAVLGFVMAVGGSDAQAADLAPYVPPQPAPMWTWTGPYAGLHVGTVDGDVSGFVFDEIDSVTTDLEFDPNGIMGGLQAGYNFQFNSIVLGVEGDISFGDVDDVIYTSIPFLADSRVEPQIDWMATVRARLGWAWDRTLFYATGGVAFTDLEVRIDSENFGRGSDEQSMFGWTVGGGVEHALTDSISFKAEYLYADFGKEDYRFTGGEAFDAEPQTGEFDLKTHTFRVGVNWLF